MWTLWNERNWPVVNLVFAFKRVVLSNDTNSRKVSNRTNQSNFIVVATVVSKNVQNSSNMLSMNTDKDQA